MVLLPSGNERLKFGTKQIDKGVIFSEDIRKLTFPALAQSLWRRVKVRVYQIAKQWIICCHQNKTPPCLGLGLA